MALNLDCPRCAATGVDPDYDPATDGQDQTCDTCGGSGELLPPTADDAYDRKGDR